MDLMASSVAERSPRTQDNGNSHISNSQYGFPDVGGRGDTRPSLPKSAVSTREGPVPPGPTTHNYDIDYDYDYDQDYDQD